MPVLEHQHPVVGLLVVAAVAEEVEDVVFVPPEFVLQLEQGCVLHAVDDNRAAIDQ